jgi:hypothetical protein
MGGLPGLRGGLRSPHGQTGRVQLGVLLQGPQAPGRLAHTTAASAAAAGAQSGLI